MLTYYVVQLYVPPTVMLNKDFLRQILTGEKELLRMEKVKIVAVPEYDELSVKNLWPHMQGDRKFMLYFPDKLPKGRLPSRDYFFNCLNTLQAPYLQNLIVHANDQRNSA